MGQKKSASRDSCKGWYIVKSLTGGYAYETITREVLMHIIKQTGMINSNRNMGMVGEIESVKF